MKMQDNELKYYDKIGNWNFDEIKYESEKITDWDFYQRIKEHTDENSLCLDLGTGDGERVLKKYPKVGMVIGTDFSKEMIKTANKNILKYSDKNVKFTCMNSLNMTFPKEIFDLVSARHTVINAEQIYDCLVSEGVLIIEGVDKKDCWELKEIFKRGQSYNDEISVAEKDYLELRKAGFSNIKKVEILKNEFYKTSEDLLALLLKTPILQDFSETNNEKFECQRNIEPDLFNKYVLEHKTDKGILLKRVLYGIIAKK